MWYLIALSKSHPIIRIPRLSYALPSSARLPTSFYNCQVLCVVLDVLADVPQRIIRDPKTSTAHSGSTGGLGTKLGWNDREGHGMCLASDGM